ncbi:MAG TPA: 2,3,4,5-tetrahydropyridine-2,6-dicarboxylate N-succinyltransferase [Gemmatimonadaceae bacterium]|nr:2,3,4,5-tetrahydropyridine-2,6-dicarboxylate N-succinyltransferase [Gemmatimonadaceae bacterium]
MTRQNLRGDALQERIEGYASAPAGEKLPPEARDAVCDLLDALEAGELRAAENVGGTWRAVPWVKRGILLGFRVGDLVEVIASHFSDQARFVAFSFVDKDTYPIRVFSAKDGVRIVPGGSTIRRGAFVSRGVVCMPPMYINVGAYVDEGTMVDSHALVGSCAQIGKRVHISAAAQVGGVLEPVNASPVVIEDDVMIGGNCGVYEGTVVRSKAVLAAGVVLTRGTPVYDLVKETVYKGTADAALEIPAGAVVVPGARGVKSGWGADQGLSLQTPVIVKYRDEKTDLATALEGWLR